MGRTIPAIHPQGIITYTAGADILEGQIVKFSGSLVVPTTAPNDIAIGTAQISAKAGEIVSIAIFGNSTGTQYIVAGGPITQGALVAANGVASAADDDVIIGRALDDAAVASEYVEIAHALPRTKVPA